MARPQGAWVPDGRAKAIRRDCEASLEALDGLPIDLYLLHAPDPRTPWRTSVRALGRLVDEGLVSRVGLANVTRGLLDEAFELAPVSAVQVALSLLDDRALRGGVVERCAELDLTLIAHSPLGGPRRAAALARRPELVAVAEAHSATPAEAALGMGARPRPERRRYPRRDAARDGSVGRARRIPRAARRRARAALAPARRSTAGDRPRRRGGRARDGDPRRGEEPPRASPVGRGHGSPEPRRAWRHAARPLGRTRRGTRVGRPSGSSSTAPTPPATREAMSSMSPGGTRSRSGACGSTHLSRRRRRTWSSASSTASARSPPPPS